MPSYQSSPSAPRGAIPTRTATLVRRSGIRAAQHGGPGVWPQAAAGCPVEQEDRFAVWVTVGRGGKLPAVGSLYRITQEHFLPFSHFLLRMGELIIGMVPVMRNGTKSLNRPAQVQLLQRLRGWSGQLVHRQLPGGG